MKTKEPHGTLSRIDRSHVNVNLENKASRPCAEQADGQALKQRLLTRDRQSVLPKVKNVRVGSRQPSIASCYYRVKGAICDTPVLCSLLGAKAVEEKSDACRNHIETCRCLGPGQC